jgi:hypothetical protein
MAGPADGFVSVENDPSETWAARVCRDAQRLLFDVVECRPLGRGQAHEATGFHCASWQRYDIASRCLRAAGRTDVANRLADACR